MRAPASYWRCDFCDAGVFGDATKTPDGWKTGAYSARVKGPLLACPNCIRCLLPQPIREPELIQAGTYANALACVDKLRDGYHRVKFWETEVIVLDGDYSEFGHQPHIEISRTGKPILVSNKDGWSLAKAVLEISGDTLLRLGHRGFYLTGAVQNRLIYVSIEEPA